MRIGEIVEIGVVAPSKTPSGAPPKSKPAPARKSPAKVPA